MPFGQSSFRRILLSRILLLTVPVLVVGMYATYRTARKAFLESARQNLTESAVRKAESINQSIEALRSNLITASEAAVLKLSSPEEHQVFVDKLADTLPTQIDCVQIINYKTEQITASSCNGQTFNSLNSQTESSEIDSPQLLFTNPEEIKTELIRPSRNEQTRRRQLQLLFSVPIYNLAGEIRYELLVKTSLLRLEKSEPGSLEGDPVVINQQGVILVHPFPERVGENISDMPDADRLASILRNAIAGREDFLHLFYLEKHDRELVAGYSAIPSPVTGQEDQKWVILAITPINSALLPLKVIRRVLLLMVLGLIGASFLATVYIARDLALPVEKLRDYALNTKHLNSNHRLPQNFHIREFQQLSLALNEMVDRLRTWGQEIVSAWEEAKKASQLKDDFLATTSHELRTPLNGIINSIRIVKDGYCDSRLEELEYLQRGDDAAIHLLKIINDVLDISKIEAGKLSVTLEKVNLKTVIDEVIELQKVLIIPKGLEFKTPVWTEPIWIDADPAKLKQVLLNIVGNAIKFTSSGSISLGVTIESAKAIDESTNPEQQAVIRITDTGIGIDPNEQDKLFKPFVMIDGSTTRKFRGTGLGLAISRNLVELMQGSIELYSAGISHGTTITIRLPLHDSLQVSEPQLTKTIAS